MSQNPTQSKPADSEQPGDEGLSVQRLVRELWWMKLHLCALILFLSLMGWGAYWMIFRGSEDALNVCRGAFLMYAAMKIEGWLTRKSGLPNAIAQTPPDSGTKNL
jgi:hypothetical protein